MWKIWDMFVAEDMGGEKPGGGRAKGGDKQRQTRPSQPLALHPKAKTANPKFETKSPTKLAP